MDRGKFYTHEEFEEIIKYTKDDKTGKITSDFIYKMANDMLAYNSFVNLSIFDDVKKGTIKRDKKRVEEILQNPKEALKTGKITPLEDKAMGALVGMAIADAMGHRFEFWPVVYDKIILKDMGNGPGGKFNLQPGQWTDDTAMGLCLADSLLMHDGNLDCHDLMHRFISWWNCGYDNAFRYNDKKRSSVGLGGNISLSFDYYLMEPVEQTKAGDKKTSGNGSIMRNAPVPVCFHADMDKALEVAERQSLVTHQGIEAAECCRVLTYITVRLLNGDSIETVLDSISGVEVDDKADDMKKGKKIEDEIKEPSKKIPKVDENIVNKDKGDESNENEKTPDVKTDEDKEVKKDSSDNVDKDNKMNGDNMNTGEGGESTNDENGITIKEGGSDKTVDGNDNSKEENPVDKSNEDNKDNKYEEEKPDDKSNGRYNENNKVQGINESDNTISTTEGNNGNPSAETKKDTKGEEERENDGSKMNTETPKKKIIFDKFYTKMDSVRALARSEIEKDEYGRELQDRNWRWKASKYTYSESRVRSNPGYIGSYAMDAMAMALHVLYTTNTFEEAVIKVVNMRGDSDSVGSVVAQMAGAFYGLSSIPKEWIDILAKWDHHEIALRGYMLAHLLEDSPSRSSLTTN